MKCTVQDDLDKGDLVEIMSHRGLPPLPLRAMHAFGNLTPARVRLLTDFIAEEMQRIVAP